MANHNTYQMQYDQRNRMNATRALYDLVYGSYKCFKKCNATYETPCNPLNSLGRAHQIVNIKTLSGFVNWVNNLRIRYFTRYY
jgi:hypothetical protein